MLLMVQEVLFGVQEFNYPFIVVFILTSTHIYLTVSLLQSI